MNKDFAKLPANLPKPEDDGACDYLVGKIIPDMTLSDKDGNLLNICDLDYKFVILYFFPMMAINEEDLPSGWNDIPGARGCTPQNVTISQNQDELLKYDTIPIGVSAQPKEKLSKLSKLRGLSQILLSDACLEFKDKLDIPTFQMEDKTMYKRLTLIVKDAKIVKVFYPVFPPDTHVFEIIEWIEENSK